MDKFFLEFTPETLIKLSIFEKYIVEWLPVFIKQPYINTINIIDYFAGPGADSTGNKGTPLIIADKINEYANELEDDQIINLIFNEYNDDHYKILEKNINSIELPSNVISKSYNKDFNKLYPTTLKLLKKAANLLILDQYGIKHVNKKVFLELISFSRTDLMFFISSATIKRFSEDKNFNKFFPGVKDFFINSSGAQAHRTMAEYFRSIIPETRKNKYYIAPFSIKKGRNIYGIIFGSGHPLGLEKFLKVCWDIDSIRGEANFDIDSENIQLEQPSLFNDYNIPNKVTLFENGLRNNILDGTLKTNKSVYIYTLENGFLPKHANSIIKELKESGTLKKKGYTLTHNAPEVPLELIKK